MPLFNMGVKDNAQVSGFELLKRRIALGIALYHTMGRSSDLYSRLYEERLINDSFRCDVSLNKGYGYLAWGGQSPDPKKTAGIITEKIKEITAKGIRREEFERIKKSQEGMFIRSLNSVDNIAREIIDSYFNDTSYFDVGKAYSEIDIEYTNKVFKEVFESRFALAVINPL
jgi:predicted Zn-dependent peptidase